MLYCAYCKMLGDISWISYASNPRVKKAMMMMMMTRKFAGDKYNGSKLKKNLVLSFEYYCFTMCSASE